MGTTAKAHSFYRGNDDGAPEVEDAESAFHELVNSGGDQKMALAAMKVAEAIKQAREVKGKNITEAEVQEAMKASTGNFKNLLRGLGIQGKDAGKKPVTGAGCYTCCAYEGLDNCRHLFTGKSNTAEYDKCYSTSTDKCLQACTGGDQAQQLSCSNTMERMAEKSGANKVPPAIKKMVDALEAKRAAQ